LLGINSEKKMGDKVALIMEKMVPDLLEFKKLGIFSHAEIKRIIKKRRNVEYEFLSPKSSFTDFLQAISFEQALDGKRKGRKRKLGYHKTLTIDFSVMRRIIQLYDRMCVKFKGKVNLWKEYLAFLIKNNCIQKIGKVIGTLLQIHSHNSGKNLLERNNFIRCLESGCSDRIRC
jgi:hypothetical protein